jgi:hypothetical protein
MGHILRTLKPHGTPKRAITCIRRLRQDHGW